MVRPTVKHKRTKYFSIQVSSESAGRARIYLCEVIMIHKVVGRLQGTHIRDERTGWVYFSPLQPNSIIRIVAQLYLEQIKRWWMSHVQLILRPMLIIDCS